MAIPAPDLSELVQARRLLHERDQQIDALTQRICALENELAATLQALHEKEVELSRHKREPTASGTEDAPPASASATTTSAAAEPRVSATHDDAPFPVLSRVSVALREGLSLPPPSQPDAVPPSRRREPRRACELELEFTDETHFYAGLTQDLSQGGVFIATYRVFPVGSRLELGFQLPDGTEVRARGVVRWVRGEGAPEDQRPGMGVAFSEISESALTAIAAFCRQRAPLYMEL